jgi:uncharacterized protein YqgC (DUF456 family)
MSLTSLINFINKIIKHNRDREGDFGVRVLMHIPIGFMIGFLLVFYPPAGIGLLLLFLVYEWTEDWRVHDHAWKDLFGGLVGCVVGILIGCVFNLFNQMIQPC